VPGSTKIITNDEWIRAEKSRFSLKSKPLLVVLALAVIVVLGAVADAVLENGIDRPNDVFVNYTSLLDPFNRNNIPLVTKVSLKKFNNCVRPAAHYPIRLTIHGPLQRPWSPPLLPTLPSPSMSPSWSPKTVLVAPGNKDR
jgi:hypothetical protein